MTSSCERIDPLPRLHVVTVAWNEEAFLPHFLRHYSNMGAAISVFDNESTDATVEIAAAWPGTTVTSFNTGGTLRDDVNSYIKSTAWRAPDAPAAEWVICVDVDELIYHPNLREYLRVCDESGYDVVVPAGVDMTPPAKAPDATSAEGQPPSPLSHRGALNALYSKPVIFSARRIESVNFGPGAHIAQFVPAPRITGHRLGTPRLRPPFPATMFLEGLPPGEGDPLLLHHRFHEPNIVDRWREREARRSDVNRRLGMGAHYGVGTAVLQDYLQWLDEYATVNV